MTVRSRSFSQREAPATYAAGYASGFFADETIRAGVDLLEVPASAQLSAATTVALTTKLFCHHTLGGASM